MTTDVRNSHPHNTLNTHQHFASKPSLYSHPPQAQSATDGQVTTENIMYNTSCNQRLFHDDMLAQESPVQDIDMTDAPSLSTSTANTVCQRKAYIFAGCGHAYISPPCTCCTPDHTLAHISSNTTLASLSPFKQTKFKQQCAACQVLTLDFQLEIAKQRYEDILELWGDTDDDTVRDYKEVGKMGRGV